MIEIIAFVFIIVVLFVKVPATKYILIHPFKCSYYAAKDLYSFFKNKKWRIYDKFGIYIYGGAYGQGKTLSIVEYINHVYKSYDNIRIISNITLHNVKYEKFEYFEQLMTEKNSDDERIIFVIDEIGSLMNSRNYKSNRISETQFIYTLNQIRKDNKTLLLASQRYGMTDKIFRNVAAQWIECSKFWRVYGTTIYDPQELEYSMNPLLVQPISNTYYYLATDKLYNSYDTKELVTDFKKNFDKDTFNPIVVEPSNLDNNANLSVVTHLSRKGKKRFKN